MSDIVDKVDSNQLANEVKKKASQSKGVNQLSDEDAQKVIEAVEPLIKQNKKKTIKPKSINLYNEEPLHVTLENGHVVTFTFAMPIPR